MKKEFETPEVSLFDMSSDEIMDNVTSTENIEYETGNSDCTDGF